MKLTNKLNLPEPVAAAVLNDSYTRGDADISVTTLIDSPQISVLKKAHDHEIEEDVADRIWALLGQAVHVVLERANQTHVAERRLSITVEGWKISGGMDLYHGGGALHDYKLTSVWTLIYGSGAKWENQLNVYAEILRQNGDVVNEIEVVAFLRDWSRSKAEEDFNYPQAPVVRIKYPLWTQERAQKYIRERVILHQQARLGNVAPCTPEERWQKETKWAVMKKVGRKSALKLYISEAEAQAHVGFDKSLYVEQRPGKFTRCLDYCQVRKFCKQAQEDRPTSEALELKSVVNE